ncbi:MAG: ATP-dependent Clp protease ATP-binding subunit [Elusimicrobia bacterium]|nr:ATP-dependent Clp protease ATP-binding subunit [Elusimicrobiota bacterium]
MLCAFVLAFPGADLCRAAASIEEKAVLRTAPVALQLAGSVPLVQTPDLKTLPGTDMTRLAETGAVLPAAPVLQSASALLEQPSLNKPEAPAGALSAEAGRGFDITAEPATRTSLVKLPEGTPTALGQVLSPRTYEPRRQGSRVTGIKARITAFQQSPLGRTVAAHLPRVAAAAAVVALAWVAHAAGRPELALGVAPILMAGTLRDKSRGAPEEAKDKDAAYYGVVRGARQPGEMLGPVQTADFGERLGLSHREAWEAVGRLADEGKFAMFSNGYNLLVELPKPDPMDLPDVEGRALAMKAVGLLNNEPMVDHARAVAMLQKAYLKYPKDDGEDEASESRRQVSYLRLNAALEVLRNVVEEHETTSTTAGPTEKSLIAEAKKYLYDAYYDTHHVALPPDQMTLDVLTDIVNKYQISRYNSHPDYKEIEAGWNVAKTVAKRLGKPAVAALSPAAAQTGRAPLMLPAPAGSKPGFNLIADDDSKFKELNKFGTNLTGLAAYGKLEPLIGRAAELRQVIKVLIRPKKNNPIVVGEPGVGKTQLVEGLALKLVKGEVPPELKDKNIFKLNLNALVAGTTLRGQFEARVEKVLKEVAASGGRVILFIDEVHMVLGLGNSEGGHDLSQVLLDAMARSGLSVIGATTLDKYRKIEKQGALNRRFQGVTLNPNTKEETLEILRATNAKYEADHKVTLPEETLKAAVDYAARYITERQLPDSALDLRDDAVAEVKLRSYEQEENGKEADRTVSPNDIATEIALRMEIPVQNVSATDKEALRAMPDELEKRVVGQGQAIKALTRAVRKSRLGYKDPNRPDIYLFLGPTGVGKTETFKALASLLGLPVTALDMSEYGEKHNIARLISAPPGYVGYEEGGQLTEPVRRKPRHAVLFDEIDKAHSDIFNILLQIAEEGRLTDGQGRRVSFKDSVVIITANFEGYHSSDEKPAMGFRDSRSEMTAEQKADEAKAKYTENLEKHLKRELINRIGRHRIIVFNELSPEMLVQIARVMEGGINKRFEAKDMTIRLTDASVKHMVDDASSDKNRKYGARPLRDILEEEVLDAMAEAELDGRTSNGDRVVVDWDPARGWVVTPDKSKK